MTLENLVRDWERWKRERPSYEEAGIAVEMEIRNAATRAGIKCETSSRTKTPSEFQKKALKKANEGYLLDPWAKITDKAGVRIIVNLESQVDQLLEILKSSTKLLLGEPEDTRMGDPKLLRYRGLHVQVSSIEYPEHECELQIRTAAQDLWMSVVSHRLLYKPLIDIPFSIQRPLYRLVSLIELFDGEVERAMNEIRNLPEEYALFELLDIAEQQFLSLVIHPEYDEQFSLQVLRALFRTITADELPTYGSALAKWVELRQTDLEVVLHEYRSEGDETDPRYLLFSQPEIIILLERLDHAHMAVEREWRDSHLPADFFEAVSAVWDS